MNRWRRILGIVFATAACGNAPPVVPLDAAVDDAGGSMEVDAEVDAGPFVCPALPGPSCPPDQGVVPVPGFLCDPFTQTGCQAGEKCAWLEWIGVDNTSGFACTPNGTKPDGCECTMGFPGDDDDNSSAGYDECERGSTCLNGVCQRLCSITGGAPACPTGETCSNYSDSHLAPAGFGVCAASCDPLQQCSTSGSGASASCGSLNPATPNLGCFGYTEFTCAAVGSTATDRELPRSTTINGCAPGFVPFFFERTGTTINLCTGLCAALEIDNTPAHVGNAVGDRTALGKLPTESMPRMGDATCEIGKKGSHASSECRFLWHYADLTPEFLSSRHLDTLGVCFAHEFFQYDTDADAVPDRTCPSCTTLPPRSAATPLELDDAADWGCQKYANSPLATATGRRARDVSFRASLSPVPIARHRFVH
jgi:hypothetical protein